MRSPLCLIVVVALGCTDRPEAEPPRDPSDPSRIVREADDDPVAAKVDGVVILRSELEERVQSQVEQFRSAGRSITQSFEQSTRVALLNHLIDRTVLTAEGKRLGLTVDEGALKHHETRFKERLGTEQAFTGYLARIGRDEAGWRADQRQHLLQKLVFDRSIRAKPVREEALRADYERQQQRFSKRRRLRLGEILKRVPSAEALPDKAGRDRVRKGAKDSIERLIKQAQRPGQRFSKLAAAQSESPSAKRGGDIGWRIEERLNPSWRGLLAGSSKGQVVGPIESPDGMRLLKVLEVEEATVLRFDDVRGELLRTAQARQRAEAERSLVRRLRQAANISVVDPRLTAAFAESQQQAGAP